MPTTKFRVWLQHPRIVPVWTGVKVVDLREQVGAGCLEVKSKVMGMIFLQLIANRQDIFAAYLQMKPERREEH